MTNPDRPVVTLDHYRDAIAICRATLAGDDDGLLALLQNAEPAMTFQALVLLHLNGLLASTGGDVDRVDTFLATFLARTTQMEET